MKKKEKLISPLQIFAKKLNYNYKLIPFNKNINYIGENKYIPSTFKEWKNTVYFFNNNYVKNIPILDSNIYNIIKGYFYSYFKNKFLKIRYISPMHKRRTFNNIFISKPDIKHINNKAIITIYIYNRQIIPLMLKMYKKLYFKIYKIFLYIYINKNRKKIPNKTTLFIWYKELIIFRRFIIKYYLNKYKFEKSFLVLLEKWVSKILDNKIEFNIINIKSMLYNTDILTEILALKLKKRQMQQHNLTNIILNKAILPKSNNIKERSRTIKNINMNLLINKYKNINLNYILKNGELGLNSFFPVLYKNYKDSINNIVLNSINYKLMNGVKLEIKGRLTKRYRADRSRFSAHWKGGLKNIDSSFRGLSVINYRGYRNSNVEYSLHTSKRRIGAFAVKGWISGK